MRPILRLLLVPLLAVACGGDPAPRSAFHDAAGRACTVDLTDVSQTAMCNADPAALVTCASGTTACFEFTIDANTMHPANCAGCCDPVKHQTLIDGMTCSPITCATDADCVYTSYHCVSGFCQ